MLPRFRAFAFFALVLSLGAQTLFGASAHPADRAANLSAAPPQKPVMPARTPLERLFIPHLQKRLSANKAVTGSLSALPQVDALDSASSVNFGGYLAAPYYPGRLESSCATDPYNCGVAVALTADFDKDGKPDVAVLQYDGTLNILSNNGKGGLSTPVAYSNPNYSSTFIMQGFAVDIDKDGYTDIVAFDGGNNAILVYLHQKDGTFGVPIVTNLPYDFGSVNSIALGDINNDGNLDAVTIASNITSVSSSDVTVQTLLGAGDGTFAAATPSLTHTITSPTQVQIAEFGIALGDLNHDGKLDMAAEFEEYTSPTTGQLVATVGLGHGDGSFDALNVNNPVSVSLSTDLFRLFINSAGVQLADLNNDSKPDLEVDAGGDLYVAPGNGDGTFSTPVKTPDVAASLQIVYTDVNGDGIPDLVQDNGVLNVWVGKGDGTFTLPANGSTYIEDSGSAQGLALADFNGDGNLDIAQLGGDYKQVSMFMGNGKGVFYGAPILSSTTDSLPAPLWLSLQTVADIQGNGNSSALFIDQSGAQPYLVSASSDGKANFTFKTALPASALTNLGYVEPIQGDFNGDGKQDILVAGIDGSLSIALSNGDGTFQALSALALPTLNCVVNYAATADLNGDGKTDIVVTYPGDSACGGSGSEPSGYFVVLGNGDGTFQTPTFTAYGAELYAVTIADMNKDGFLDLLLDDAPFNGSGDFGVDLLPGNGDGTFGAGAPVSTNYEVSQVIAGDYNQDGKPDLILLTAGEESDQNAYRTAGILLLPGAGDGTFGAPTQIGTGNFFLEGLLADVNNDGIPDLVASLYRTVGQPKTYYGLSTLLGIGNGAFSIPVNTLESLSSSSPFAGNFYSDNAPDIIVSTGYGTALFVGQGGTSMTVGGSASTVAFGQAETLTATLNGSIPGRPAPSGTVSFYDGTNLIGSGSLSGNSATFSTSSLSVGSHNISAVYSGDANFNPNTASTSAISVSAVAPAFTLTPSPASLTLSRGQNGAITLSLAANATFSGSVALACSGAPTKATCAVNPGNVTLAAGGTASATLVIGTTSAHASARPAALPWAGPAGIVSFAAFLFAFNGRRARARILSLLMVVALAITGLALTGCGSSSVPTAAKGTYTVTVTATPSGSGGAAQSSTISITIQ